jgi:hypothetical protein
MTIDKRWIWRFWNDQDISEYKNWKIDFLLSLQASHNLACKLLKFIVLITIGKNDFIDYFKKDSIRNSQKIGRSRARRHFFIVVTQ